MIKDSYSQHQSIVNLCKDKTKNELELSYLLYTLRRYDLWRNSVGGIDTWEDYLRQPEIAIPTSKANQLIRIYEYFGVNNPGYDLTGIPISKLDHIAKKNKKVEKIGELLLAARELSTSDFKELFLDTVEENPSRTYSFLIMKKCNETGTLKKVHDIDSELIKTTFNL